MVRRTTARAWETYRAHFAAILTIGALILIPGAALAIGLRELVEEVSPRGEVGDILRLLAKASVGGVGYFMIVGVITEIVVAHRRGREKRGVGAVIRSLPFGALLLVDLIVTVSISIGMELFVLPGLIIAARFALAPVLIEIEHHGAADSLRRSFELSRRRGAAVLAVLAATLALTYGFSLPFKAAAEAFLPSFPAEMLALLLAGLIVKPFGAVMEVELALDLLGREEGTALPGPRAH